MTKIARDKMASLSEENIKCLYRCENKTKRRQVMGKILNCPSCDSDEDDIKTSILLDFYLESINFAAEGGFSWQQGLAVFELMKELLNDTLELQLLPATEHFKIIIQKYTTRFSPQRLTTVIDFAFSFFFNHFNLYKYVFTKERDVDRRTTYLTVETPPQDIPELGKGTEKSEWDCQQNLKKLEEEHNRKQMEKQLQLNSEIERLQSLVQDKLCELDTEQSITAEDLNQIVQDIMGMYVSEAGLNIQHLISESQEKLEYEIERSAIGQEMERNVKTSAGKTKSPGTGLGKKKAKANKPGKG